MKVGQVNYVNFKSNEKFAEKKAMPETYPEINNLPSITPDFSVKAPQTYKKLGVEVLNNGLELYSYKLANGHRVTIVPMEGSPAVVKNYVNVGSMNETSDIKGISHFLEHMAFNGTNGENGHIKLEVGDAFRKIDEIGGWSNASTNYAITDYVNSAPLLKEGDLEKQIQIIGAMTEDLQLSDEMIAKEKKPVCSEINMILDDPQTIALDQTVRTLFGVKNPADELVGGSVGHIKNLTRKDVLDYYHKYYTPDNMNLVITGDVKPDEVMKIVSKNFNSRKVSQGKKFEEKLNPIKKTVRKDFVSDKAVSTQIVLGFAGAKNNDVREKVLFDAAKAYINSHSSGLKQNLKKYNSYPYVDSEKISTNPNNPRMIYMGLTASKENSEKVLTTLFNTISNLKPVTEASAERIKQKLLKNHEEAMEFSSVVNDKIGQAILDGNIENVTEYENILNSLTAEDINRAVKKYFDLNKAAITVVHPQAQAVSFRGKKQPVDTKSISEYRLANNFDVGLYKTKSNNISYNIDLMLDKPYNKKPGVVELLNEMYSMGSASMSEEELNNFKEENNINLSAFTNGASLGVCAKSRINNRGLLFEKAADLLYNPRLTQENLDTAKKLIKDSLSRQEHTAYQLYLDYDSKNNPYDFSADEILNSIDDITLDDIKECHQYLINNSRGLITANLPKSFNIKDEVLTQAGKLNNVLPNNVKELKVYTPSLETTVLTKANNNSQADIIQTFKFKCDNSIKETAAGKIMNSILSSSSIGLFDVLREKEHLAYSVHSEIDKFGDSGEVSLNILTTTDNKAIGEMTYDNVQKSINGFNRQINELLSGHFTESDLENAKLAVKAGLLENEGTKAKLASIGSGLNSKHGITYLNKLYREIDLITKQDILDFAGKVFAAPPVYSIVASQDTLDFNKEFLDNLKK